MSDNYELENNAIDGKDETGSVNHSFTQVMIASLLVSDSRFTVFSELSLDISQYDLSKYRLGIEDEIKPDVCSYLNAPVIPDEEDDLVKVAQMPDLAIEILSPRQSVSYLIRKTNAYLATGVKSCWLVIPANKYIAVYSGTNQYKSFDVQHDTELVDDAMDIRLPIVQVFRK